MAKALQSLLVLSGLLCLALGFEPGFQFVYKYHGRALVGINELKRQTAVAELQGRVIVQSTDATTLYVKIAESSLKFNGSYYDNPYFTDDDENDETEFSLEEIEGELDNPTNQEVLSTPFVIYHKFGSIVSVQIGSSEPNWIVNLKKSVASQLQLDITGEGSPYADAITPPTDFNSAITTFEDSVTGNCSTIIQINRLPMHQVYETDAFDFGSFETVCKGSNVWEVVKTKDFNRCMNNTAFHTAIPPSYMCTLGRAQCGEAIVRTSTYSYIGCGPSADKMTVVHIKGYGELNAQPFGIKTERISGASQTYWILERKEAISTMLAAPSSPLMIDSLSYSFDSIESVDGTDAYPELTSPWFKPYMPTGTLIKGVMAAFQNISNDLKTKPDADQDNLERLTTIGRVLPMLSVDEFRGIWAQIKGQDAVIVDLFVDSVVGCGSNPAIMFLKEMIETEQIKGARAVWAIGGMGYYAKTPTRELLHEMINLIKSSPVQASKTMKQTAFLTVADLLSAACDSPFYKEKRFPVNYLGDFCNSHDSVLVNEFLPLISQELSATEGKTGEHMAVLTAIGSLGVPEVLAILAPHIKGNENGDDTAERTRAIYSLHRVMYSHPEKVMSWIVPIADNVAERPEVRMAAISLLFTVNAPMVMWQKIATRTWYETSTQVQSFVYDMLFSMASLKPTTPAQMEVVSKARAALTLAKPAPFGLPYSASYMRSSFLREGLGAVLHTPFWRVADEMLPVAFSVRQGYTFGPFNSNPVEIYGWNYNMEDFWTGLFGKLTGKSEKQTQNVVDELKSSWDEIKPTARPDDKTTGFLQVKLMNSITRVYDLLQLETDMPKWIGEIMSYQSKPIPVSFLKYRMLAEINVRVPTEMGLPMRFLATLPILVSFQGQVQGGLTAGIQADITNEVSWKLTSEIRVEMPWSGNYIASGVDVRSEFTVPKEWTFKYSNGFFNFTWTPSDKVTDLLYYHVKPYTVGRNVAESVVPVTEDFENVHIINATVAPFERHLTFGGRYGVNVTLHTVSELDHFDLYSWVEYLNKYDANSFSNLAFVPLTVRHRQYNIRYSPKGTSATMASSYLNLAYLWKNSQRSTVYETGTSKPISESTEIKSAAPLNAISKNVSERIFKEVDGGSAYIAAAGFQFYMQDGSYYVFNATVGVATDDMYTKDFRDLRVERSFVDAGKNKKVDYVICGTTSRNWNNAPAFGFSNDVLYMTEDSRYGFGKNCEESKFNFKAKVYRNETVAAFARNTTAGLRCQEHIKNGMLNSPACAEARHHDQTYNVYELNAEVSNLPTWSSGMFKRAQYVFNTIVTPFIVEHRLESNNANRISWTIKRNPFNGDSDMTIVRPTETIEARNVRGASIRFSPLMNTFSKVFYPLNANKNFFHAARAIATANVTNAQCFVGPNMVYTFDGPAYNYTFDGCDTVLVTDSFKQYNFAVTSRMSGDHKIATVIYEKDVFVIDPTGTVTINGVKSQLSGRFQVQDGKRLIAEFYPLAKGIKFILHPIGFGMKVHGKFIELNAPVALRGQTAGVCGDYNQEESAEWRTASRCALSSGELMAASFRLSSGEGCSALRPKLAESLKRETEMCYSIDEKVRTHLPTIDINAPTPCTTYEPLSFKTGSSFEYTCTSTKPTVRCQPGCKPTYMTVTPFTFHCDGGDMTDFATEFTVPVSCNTY